MFEFICRSSLTLWLSEQQDKGTADEVKDDDDDEDGEAENLLGNYGAINHTEEDELQK